MKTINLSNFGLQGVEPMSRDEMRGIVGGYMPTSAPANCSATCADGSPVEITDCKGTCSCTDNVGCECTGSKPLTKSCEGTVTNIMP